MIPPRRPYRIERGQRVREIADDTPAYMRGPQPPAIARAPDPDRLKEIHGMSDDELAALPIEELLDATLEANHLFRSHRDPRIIGYYQFFLARLKAACASRMRGTEKDRP